MKVGLYSLGEVADSKLEFAVIYAACNGKWIFVRHKDRNTWEMPGGHREKDEDIAATAARELQEETGAVRYTVVPVCDYSVTREGGTPSYGRLFYSEVTELGPLPQSEICQVQRMKRLPDALTYPEIQPHLHEKILTFCKEKALTLLQRDRARNINLINFMKSYPIDTVTLEGESVLIRGRSDEDWVYISSESREEFEKLIRVLDEEDQCFAILEDWMLPYIVGDREVRSQLTSIKLVYDEKVPLPENRYPCIPLAVSDAPHLYANSKYKEYTSIEYIEERITTGVGYGIWQDGKLVTWALTHDDGAIGFLHVLEEYRKRGYAKDVSIAMIRRLLEMGDVPYEHIEEENEASMNLALSIGFKKDRRIHWFKLK